MIQEWIASHIPGVETIAVLASEYAAELDREAVLVNGSTRTGGSKQIALRQTATQLRLTPHMVAGYRARRARSVKAGRVRCDACGGQYDRIKGSDAMPSHLCDPSQYEMRRYEYSTPIAINRSKAAASVKWNSPT